MKEYNELKDATLGFKPSISKHMKLYFDKNIFEHKII